MIGTIFLVVAAILFLLAALGVAVGGLQLVPLGLACLAAGHLPWGSFRSA